jgi:DNA mismatch repair protein MutL
MATQPPIIRQLPDLIANQIAAGEVVERPAAVVKELAENALDAGAKHIVIRLEDGGRRLVEVEDDGHGMRADDLRLAVSRHATSKIYDADDLFRISTLGFRGEALPSIAGVSEISLASRLHDAAQGYELSLSGGSETGFSPCAMAAGTRISVRNLFWNVPARLKFLKTEAAEAGHVTDQVMRLALSHPNVAFRLAINNRTAIDQPSGETLQTRVRSLFGAALADRLLAVAHHTDTMQIAGFVAHPQEARPTTKRQFIFLNGRFVKDRLLFAAIRDGFKGFLEPRLHGTVFLHLDLDPSQVDVNVHPTKSEVRFRREGEVFAFVRQALHMVLSANAGGFSLLPTNTAPAPAGPPGSAIIQRTIVRPASLIQKTVQQPAQIVVQERFIPPVAPLAEPENPEPLPNKRVAETTTAYVSSAPAASPATSTKSTTRIRRVLQLNRMFVLIETDRGIRLVDQHALHEKALLHVLDPSIADMLAHGRQELLMPITIDLLRHEVALLAPLLPEIARVGILASVTPQGQIAITAYPALLKRTNWARFFAELASSPAPGAVTSALSERLAHSAACHAAVKAGQELGNDELWELARLLDRFDDLEHCPHGRPTTLDLSWSELERRFQRS